MKQREFEFKKISDHLFEVQRHGAMRVPCRIYATEEMLKKMMADKTVVQGVNVASLPGIRKYSLVMPDGHEGYGFPIGGVAAFDHEEGGISPGGIGYDINCGVRLLSSDMKKEEVAPKMRELVDTLFRYCPPGIGSSNFNIAPKDLDAILLNGSKWAIEKGYGEASDVDRCEEGGRMEGADAKAVSETAKKRGHDQLATLGSGNHFLEVQIVDEIFDRDAAAAMGIFETGQVMFMIHCGSRALGHQVCSDYLRAMEKQFPDILHSLPDRELIYAPTRSDMAWKYYSAMCAAANFAWCNRHMLAHQLRLAVRDAIGKGHVIDTVYDVAHNIAKIEEYEIDGRQKRLWVHRKGATRAFGPDSPEIPAIYRKIGQPIILPGSMGTASYVLAGTAGARRDTFGSTAHGAGRVMSRNEATKSFRGENIVTGLARDGITVRGASMKGLAEEASAAYKSIDEVVAVSHNASIGRRVARLRPIGVIKG